MFDIRNARQYIEKLLWIRTKEGEERRLILKPAQKKLLDVVEGLEREGKPVRVIVLKARQEGISTLISGWIFARCATRENRVALLVAHVNDATANLHNMHLRFYDRLPGILRPLRAASNAIEIVFANPAKDPEARAREPGLRSRIRCATAGGKGVGRSDTIQYVHASEYAFWPDGLNAKQDTLLGILQAVPALPGTAVFIESTAKGFDDFHKRWEDAVSGRSDFVPVFFSWAEEPGYRRPVPPGTIWTEEELALAAEYKLEPEQLAWRRWCIANNCNGDIDRFHQEYPISPEEAFIASGACWFNVDILTRRLRELEDGGKRRGVGDAAPYADGGGQCPPLRVDGGKRRGVEDAAPYGVGRGVEDAAPYADGGGQCPPLRVDGRSRESAVPTEGRGVGTRGRFRYRKVWSDGLQRSSLADIEFVPMDQGPVTIWRQPEERVPYVMGGDTAGEGSDWFGAYVIDNTSAQMCARIYMQYDEAEFTAQVFCLGRYYNKALVGLEVNFSTYPVQTLEEWGYERLYVRQAEDSYLHEARRAFGWRTDPVTRPAMLSELRESVEAHPEIIVDDQLIREMMVFVKDKTGRPAALEGEHDDLVMSYGITLKIRGQQSAVREQAKGQASRYTEDMLEDWRRAGPSERAMLEARWGKPY